MKKINLHKLVKYQKYIDNHNKKLLIQLFPIIKSHYREKYNENFLDDFNIKDISYIEIDYKCKEIIVVISSEFNFDVLNIPFSYIETFYKSK